jgi:hypothetical protein
VCTDLAARAPPINRLFVIDDGFSVFAASEINDILSRMCSNLTCKLKWKKKKPKIRKIDCSMDQSSIVGIDKQK